MHRIAGVTIALFVTALPVAAARRHAALPPGTITVTTTIQAAVDRAHFGDIIEVPAGVYRESVVVTKSGITIRGRSGAVLDGNASAKDGIAVRAASTGDRLTGFTLSGMTIQNFTDNGVILTGVDRFSITDSVFKDNDEYGVFPILSSAGRIANNTVSGSDDTGIYVGESDNVVVEGNVVTDCTVGYDLENSTNIIARNNVASGNTLGFTTEVLPGLTLTKTTDIQITGNTAVSNNRPNPVKDPNDILSLLPSGVGILDLGADRVTISNNQVNGNNSAGIAIVSLPASVAALDPRIEGIPDGATVTSNIVHNNGASPDPKIAPLPGADIVWDFSGTSICFSGNQFDTSFPPSFGLPPCP